MTYEPQFLVSVIRVNKGHVPLPDDLRTELVANAIYEPRYCVWFFEGDWELWLEPWMEKNKFEHLGDVTIVGSLGGLSFSERQELLEDNFSYEQLDRHQGGAQ